MVRSAKLTGELVLAPQQLLRASRDQPWSDVGEIDWAKVKETGFLSPAEHCDYRFLAQVEGRSRHTSVSVWSYVELIPAPSFFWQAGDTRVD